MKNFILLTMILFLCTTSSLFSKNKTEPLGKDNIASKWGKMAITATANDTDKFRPRPTVTSRFLGLTFVAVFDAWSRYDQNAIPVYLNDAKRRPSNEQTLKNKEIAISYVAYGALCEYYYSDKELFSSFMKKLGLDSTNQSVDPTTSEGIRRGDGSNQYGEKPGSNDKPY
jgi:hypothetical protein